MAAATVFELHHQKHGHFMTCYRPIVLSLKTVDPNVAFFKGTLYRRDTNDNWYDTGIIFNAYRDAAHTGLFMCNVMEYCRQFFYTNDKFFNNKWCASYPGEQEYIDMFLQDFRVKFYPVTYGPSSTLIEETSNYKYCSEFTCIPTNTRTMEGYSSIDDYIRVDKFVVCSSNATAVSWPGSAWNETLTNMPDGNLTNYTTPLLWNCIVTPRRNSSSKRVQMEWSWTGANAGSFSFLSGNFTATENSLAVYLMNPGIQSFFAWLSSDPTQYDIVSAAGNLVEEGILMTHKQTYKNTNGSNWRSGPSHTVKLTDKRNHSCGKSGEQWTEFIFKNMFGGIDWFIATGTHEKNISTSGATYSKFTNFDRNQTDFGVWKGQHSTTSLWVDRKDEFSVTSQPLVKEQVLWLEELITSPEAWIVHEGIDMYNDKVGFPGVDTDKQPKRLVPIIINPGSYEVLNTKDNVYFMKFTYTLSEPITTQKN